MEELPVDPAEGAAQQAPAARLFRRVYTVCFAQPSDGVARKRPQDYSKEAFAVLLEQRHVEVFAAVAADGVPVNTVEAVAEVGEAPALAEGDPPLLPVAMAPPAPEAESPERKRARIAQGNLHQHELRLLGL